MIQASDEGMSWGVHHHNAAVLHQLYKANSRYVRSLNNKALKMTKICGNRTPHIIRLKKKHNLQVVMAKEFLSVPA